VAVAGLEGPLHGVLRLFALGRPPHSEAQLRHLDAVAERHDGVGYVGHERDV
jgi:hypothetical protein